MSRSLHSDLNDPSLFEENQPGVYEYGETAYGQSGSGALSTDNPSARDGKAQLAAGGEDRRTSDNEWGADDGGHLIGVRFGGLPDARNLYAQNRNCNRGAYKRMENEWAKHLESGDKVFVNVETYANGGRPSCIMGHVIYQHPDGTRDWEVFSINNESTKTQDEWDKAMQDAYKQDPQLANMMPNSDMHGLSPEEWEKTEDSADELQFGAKGAGKTSTKGSVVTVQTSQSNVAVDKSFDYLGTAAVDSDSQKDAGGMDVGKSDGESTDVAEAYLGTASTELESQKDAGGMDVGKSDGESTDVAEAYLGTASTELESQEDSAQQSIDQGTGESADQSSDDSQDMD